tara:strand:+ start:3014 stop:3427 length:414 start_codon:yes stop_codon:yes gene_type:complete
MNTVLLFLVALPALEIFLIIKVGQNIGALSTIAAIFLTAIIGIYYARIEGLNTLRSGIYNLYKNKSPIFEMISGASIAFAALLLMIPGFVTDFFGFLLLIPFTRKKIINLFFVNKKSSIKEKNYIDGEIVEKDKDEL